MPCWGDALNKLYFRVEITSDLDVNSTFITGKVLTRTALQYMFFRSVWTVFKVDKIWKVLRNLNLSKNTDSKDSRVGEMRGVRCRLSEPSPPLSRYQWKSFCSSYFWFGPYLKHSIYSRGTHYWRIPGRIWCSTWNCSANVKSSCSSQYWFSITWNTIFVK